MAHLHKIPCSMYRSKPCHWSMSQPLQGLLLVALSQGCNISRLRFRWHAGWLAVAVGGGSRLQQFGFTIMAGACLRVTQQRHWPRRATQHGTSTTNKSSSPSAGWSQNQGSLYVSLSAGTTPCVFVQLWWFSLFACLNSAQTCGTASSLHLC